MACWNIQSLLKLNMNASEENMHLMSYEVMNFDRTTLHLHHVTVVVYKLIAAMVGHGNTHFKTGSLICKKLLFLTPMPITHDFE